jgi:glycosyltransferase involved in cell wall biosynthesis
LRGVIQYERYAGTDLMKITICVITYNHANYIAKCLESILQQRVDFNFEILLGEDDSTDGTRDICKSYQSKFSDKIHLFLNDRKDVISINGRPTGRWNLLNVLSRSNGEYIALCEGDDYWTDPLKLQKQVDFLETHPDFSICGHWVRNVNDAGESLSKFHFTGEHCPEIITSMNALGGTPFHTSSWVFRNVIGDMFKKHLNLLRILPAGDDPLLLLILNYGKGYCFQEFMGVYRIHSAGAWTSKVKALKQFEMLTHYYSIPQLLGPAAEQFSSDYAREAEIQMIRLLPQSFGTGQGLQLMKIIHKSSLITRSQLLLLLPRAFFYLCKKFAVRIRNKFNQIFLRSA